MTTNSSSWLNEAFVSAKKDFIKGLNKSPKYDFQRFGSVDDVYNAAEQIQMQQAKTKTLRGLGKIKPFIEGLQGYARTIEVFVQVQPEILALIWGPVKFILQISSSVITAFGKVVNLLAEIGHTIPQFNAYASLFRDNEQVKRVLHLFYVDILEFYKVLLNFLDNRRLNTVLEMLWPIMRSKITVIQEGIDRHKMLMTSHVALEDIEQSYKARKRALQEYEQAQIARDNHEFNSILAELCPHMYGKRLAEILDTSVVDSGEWLRQEFMQWVISSNSTNRYFWLKGIPGSGKTFIVANIAHGLQASGKLPLLVFLSHTDQTAGRVIEILHSLVFQAVKDDFTMRQALNSIVKGNMRKFSSNRDFVKDVIIKIFNSRDSELIILDGLDELEEERRQMLLNIMNEILDSCSNVKVLLSSREERDIARVLENRSVGLRVDHHNAQAIQAYAHLECQKWIAELESNYADKQMCNVARICVQRVIEKSEGMILYTRLVLQAMRDQGTLVGIEAELENLPDGLDAAYARIISRITQKLSSRLRSVVSKLLQWIMCAKRSLRVEELLQILVIEPSAADFTKGRKEIQDICKVCGPIVEIRDEHLFFVHFSAKEYLLHHTSDIVDLRRAEIGAALICSSYLAYTPLNVLFRSDLEDESDIDRGALSGNFVFFEYASQEWLEHVKQCVEEPLLEDDLQNLTETLCRLFNTRGTKTTDTRRPTAALLNKFKSFDGVDTLQTSLATAEMLMGKARHGFLDLGDLENFSGPLRIVTATRTLRRRIETLVDQYSNGGDKSRSASLQRLYGSFPFYCSHIPCDRYRSGFATKSARDEHLKTHAPNYKCSKADCIYSNIGFKSKQALSQHMFDHDLHHPTPTATGHAAESNDDEILLMLKDAVAHDDVDCLRGLGVPNAHVEELVELAAWKAGSEILEYLLEVNRSLPKSNQVGLNKALHIAIETENRPAILCLWNHGADIFNVEILQWITSSIMHKARQGLILQSGQMINGFSRALSLWNPDLMRFLIDDCRVSVSVRLSFGSSGDFCCAPALAGLTSDEVDRRFTELKKYIRPGAFDKAIRHAILYNSVQGLRICLENQGNPNQTFGGGETPLYNAVRMGTNVGAEMAKLLLKYGADPDVKYKRRHITQLSGMKKLETYFAFQLYDFIPCSPYCRRATLCDTTLPVGSGSGHDAPIFIPKDATVGASYCALHRGPKVFDTKVKNKREQVHLTGETRTWTRKGVSGLDVVYNFCVTCPTIVIVRAESLGGNLIVKSGLLDSVADIERLPPKVELFVKDRIDPWCERSSDVVLKEID
ncbi:hypothetical protein NUW58_g904 [Xylaria curta]|uniref:Uncharacterized protein n=1 Tax=Xylaria curta TaxID=42375 RepID=A0ACC1PQT6_9PEZI|nr:hypothetical protein NUW58_g904 [Xylaria curta]